MGLIRLYVNAPLSKNKDVPLDAPQSHYLQKVMRLKEGAEVSLFNGQEGEWKAQIKAHLKKSTVLTVLKQSRPQEKEGDLWLLFSPLKPKRMEFLVEKATELGVSCLWPIHCERTSLPKVNQGKMETHALEAAEQCGRLTLPEIRPLTKLTDMLNSWPQERRLYFGDETLTAPSLSSLKIEKERPKAFLVGPEGGFSEKEFEMLRSLGQGVTLNRNILRAETAALVGVSLLLYE